MKKNRNLDNGNGNSEFLTSDDFDKIRKIGPLNRYGYPSRIPLKNRMAKNVLLKVIDGEFYDSEGKLLSDGKYDFDVLESERFDGSDPLKVKKLPFLFALFSNGRKIKGAIYFKGQFVTDSLKPRFRESLMSYFMEHYFSVSDTPLIYVFFQKESEGIPSCLPTLNAEGERVIFQAYQATVTDKRNLDTAVDSYTFTIRKGDMFDFSSKEDLDKIAVIKSLLDRNKEVRGFYYKGRLIPSVLSEEFRLYLEKSFVKKNFSVEDRDYILMNVTKDAKTGYPLFFPMRKREGKPISISVLNCDVQLLGYDKRYSSFHITADRSFDIKKEEDRIRLKIVQALLFKKTVLSGALYLDGMLTASLSKSELERRRVKAENACGLYLDDSEDFVRINTRFTVEDRFSLLRLTGYYDRFYPDDITSVPSSLKGMKKKGILVRFDRVNVVSEDGGYVFDHDFSLDVRKGEVFSSLKSEALVYLVRAMYSKGVRIRGGIYYHGRNVLCSPLLLSFFKKAFVERFVDREVMRECMDNPLCFYQYHVDRKTGMLDYFPTTDQMGREVLLSVVSANIFFGNGKKVVKAAQNLNFDVHVGETFGLVGESGSGKTTISRAILGINRLHSGGIYFKGKLISTKLSKEKEKQNKKNIQMIFQDPAASLNERANVDYIVSEGLYNFHLFRSKEERIAKVSDMMEAVGLLPEHLSRYPHEFSGGQRQRIGIARALVIEPELILADEPISALDVSIRAQVLNLLRELQKKENLTYLFIAHDLSIIRYISDRIAVMHQGHIVELGKAEDIYLNPIHPYTKALLTAIPQPDPKTNGTRKRYVYQKADLDYEKCKWFEVKPGHFVLVREKDREDWVNGKIDSKYLTAA